MPSMLLVALAAFALLARSAVAQTPAHSTAAKRIAGLSVAATLDRDQQGIAHISADNEHDLFFLQGFVHAQDRLFQMDVTRMYKTLQKEQIMLVICANMRDTLLVAV